MWEEFKDKKDASGFPFKMTFYQALYTSCHIGLFAGSEDSYKTFAPMFDKVIEDYHKHPVDAKHVSDMNADNLKCDPFTAEEAAHIISTRIRVARNFSGYDLPAHITKEKRLEVMNKIKDATSTFDGDNADLAGQLYPLEGMDQATKQQLIDDHFLFNEGDDC